MLKQILASKKKRLISLAFLLILLGGSGWYLFKSFKASGATYSWVQTSWISGADTVASANHTSNQTGWTKFFSKDDNVSIGAVGELSLTPTTSVMVATADADFASGTKSNTYVSSGSIALLKPHGVSCSLGAECSSGLCQGGVCKACDTFIYSGRTYQTVAIGSQCWMKKNLDVGTYVTSIPSGSQTNVANNGTIEKYCYGNDTTNCTNYGALYDWNEAMAYATTSGAQGICPVNWHIPSDAEWSVLETNLATSTCAGNRVDSWDCVPAGKNMQNLGISDFAADLTGFRLQNSSFSNLGSDAFFMTSSQNDDTTAWYRRIASYELGVLRGNHLKMIGAAVRCVQN